MRQELFLKACTLLPVSLLLSLQATPLGDVLCDDGKTTWLSTYNERRHDEVGEKGSSVLSDLPYFFLYSTVLFGLPQQSPAAVLSLVVLQKEGRRWKSDSFLTGVTE